MTTWHSAVGIVGDSIRRPVGRVGEIEPREAARVIADNNLPLVHAHAMN